MTQTPGIADAARYERAVASIERVNRDDPNGREGPHALAVCRWIIALRPDASEALRLAGRAQHLGRWRVPRNAYPSGRPGYLRWRADLQARHAAQAAGILTGCGYPESFVERVRALMHKRDLKQDPETQTLEDALCLVFIEQELEAFSGRHDQATLERILRRTWAKMGPAGRQAALALPSSETVKALLERAT